MSTAEKKDAALKAVRLWLKTHPSRRRVTLDEFAGGRAPWRDPGEPPTPYKGDSMDKGHVAYAFSRLQSDGILGRPNRPSPIPWDNAMPRHFPVLRTPE